MRTLWLFLLVLLWYPTSEAADLNQKVLARIVTSFRQVSGIEPNATHGGGQFSFLLALTPQQCTDPNQAVSFSPSGAGGAPIIDFWPNDGNWPKHFIPDPPQNYMAIYPNNQQCSERMLLHQQKPRKSPAHRFQDSINNKLTVGCVIFYTTYTPCINRCFSNNETCKILPDLSQAPFNTAWAQGKIQKYFVFRKVYRYDRGNIPKVIENLKQIANVGFTIRRCDRVDTEKPIECRDCKPPEKCMKPASPPTGA